MNLSPSARRRRTAVGAAALAATLALATSVFAATRGHQAATHQSATAASVRVTTIGFRAHEIVKPTAAYSAKPTRPRLGDQMIEQEVLYANGRRIGYDLTHFTFAGMAQNGPDMLVHGAIVLEDGTIDLLGETTFKSIRVAVVGGTGAYQQATGELRILRTLKNGDDIDLLRIVRPASTH
jgi:hypothetical protein